LHTIFKIEREASEVAYEMPRSVTTVPVILRDVRHVNRSIPFRGHRCVGDLQRVKVSEREEKALENRVDKRRAREVEDTQIDKSGQLRDSEKGRKLLRGKERGERAYLPQCIRIDIRGITEG
jgi:hypothetical protein